MDFAYLTKGKGLPNGKIKRRYEDFIVQEITPDERVCEIFSEDPKEHCELKIPKGDKKYIHLELTKTNHDLHFAIRKISKYCRLSSKRFGYAGIKDKRAITCQRISIFKPDVKRLEKAPTWGLKMTNPVWSNEEIRIGDLLGNNFTVTIKFIQLDEKETKLRILESFKQIQKGIPNYFGPQRFGGIRKVSHLVGLELLRGDVKKAVELFLSHPSEEEFEDIKKARELARTGKLKESLNYFSDKHFYERAIVSHLIEQPNDYAGAFANLPKKIRYLFTHAFQSYYFNELINERINSGIGLKQVDGEAQEDGVAMILLPGYESEFSPGKIREMEKKLLKKFDLTFEDFKLKTLAECSSKGNRRKALIYPKNLKLISVESDEEGTTARVSFELEKGSYATNLLRELIRDDRMEFLDKL